MAEDVCDIHIKDSILPKALLEDMTRAEMANLQKSMKAKNPAELAQMRDLMNANIKAMVDDGINFRIREVSDIIKVQELKDKYMRNRITGEPLRTYSEVVENRLKALVGRNSVDTKARNLRNHLRNQLYEFESVFRTHENTTAPKSISEIKKGSAQEEELYILVRSYEHEIDPATLTPEKVEAYLKTATEMQRLALSIVSYNAYTRKILSSYGISTKFSKNYVTKRRYDWAAVEAMGPEKFANYLYDRLDIDKTFGKGTTKEQALFALRDVYKNMKKNAIEKLDVTSNKEFSGAKANSFEAKFEWKGHKEAYEAFRDLSVGGLKDQIEQGASGLANRAIAISEFGYNPEKVLAQVSSGLLDAYGETPKTIDQWRLSQIKRAEKELSGRQHLVQGSFTNLQNNVRFLAAFTKLGNAVTGTILDAVDNGRQSFYMNGDFFGGVKDYVSNFLKVTAGMNDAQRHEVANNINLIFSHLSNAEGMRLASGDIATRGGKITSWVQEHGSTAMNIATLLPWQTGRSNIASGIVGARQFARLVGDAKTGKLNKFQTDFLNEYGFTPEEIKALGDGFFENAPNWSDTPIFTGTGIRNALTTKTPEAVAKALGVDPSIAGEAVIKLATKIESVINDHASRGTPKPELATKTLMGKNIDNEGVRVAIGFATQFLDTPIAQAQYVAELAEKLYRVNGGNIAKVVQDSALPSAAYLTTGLSLYMAADGIMAALTNRPSIAQKYSESDKAGRASIMMNAIGRTSYVPFLFEMIETQTNGGYNKTALDTFGSPALSTLRDTLRLAKGEIDGGDFLVRQGPTNSLPLRAANNWYGQFNGGEKIWDDKQKTFFGGN